MTKPCQKDWQNKYAQPPSIPKQSPQPWPVPHTTGRGTTVVKRQMINFTACIELCGMLKTLKLCPQGTTPYQLPWEQVPHKNFQHMYTGCDSQAPHVLAQQCSKPAGAGWLATCQLRVNSCMTVQGGQTGHDSECVCQLAAATPNWGLGVSYHSHDCQVPDKAHPRPLAVQAGLPLQSHYVYTPNACTTRS